MNESTEVIQELLESIGIEKNYRTEALTLLEKGESRYLRDLKLNFTSTLTSAHLTAKECALLGLSTAVNNNNTPLTVFFTKYAQEQGADAAEIAEAVGCASLLASNNVFYRFRHFTQKEKYTQIPARIRMQLMMKPVTGKEFFELMSLAISAVNGCEMCVNAHEDSLIKLSTTEERIFDAVRIASLITSAGKLIF
ncbi:carboxymuconolactone decarboxylase family protein [Mucilaginibacter lappiensis]|uniref:Alkyl hydroperoxide reductase AhpD n=1 Tax=Mucilaginibacter lappiensis TaxID=354630 RepID=A0A1N7G2P9_9SPHI|nr:carboxymuconolactone decarboxylase family protein [Mucilaginibacter lappiensis]MBB6112810.1 alkyl hydroperoxide reductase subunit D [Mucilaginibacter lappiensis]MBB6129787.1 alkyl hydroperoxide reductase subunit D [Mucilaginibacter lappiensis]SIS06831.1 alkyl hydroperoxide reductase subunit D [Mucilaginibacter lappiensis]